ncbi:MAG TPA: class I SAM-dependent methyltransferase [Nitrospiraceae bacterium]|nr:class I SAM-dependent methyltransferase [Nitrospiraceae bacterium]
MLDCPMCICGLALERKSFSTNFDAWICSNCRSHHFMPRHSESAREFLYGGDNPKYNEASYLCGKQLRWAHRRLLARQWSGKKVLEIGCFNGFFLDDLLRRGADVYGFDVNETALAVGSKLFGLEGRLFSSFEAIQKLGTFDEILCIDLLEHLDSPGDLLQEIGSMLDSKGKIVVASPTLERRFHDKSDYPPHHKWWFSRRGLEALLKRSGYTVNEVYIQRDGLLMLRNFVGKVLHGFQRREFYGDGIIGSPVAMNRIVAVTYDTAAWLGHLLFTVLGITYCSTLIIAAKVEPR